jgi:hypothetical protein
MEISIRPPLSTAAQVAVNDLFRAAIDHKTNTLPKVPTIKIKTFLFGKVMYDMKNLTLTDFHIDEKKTRFWLDKDRIKFEIRDLDISTTGLYSLRYNGMESKGEAETRTKLNLVGEYMVFLAEQKDLGVKLINIDTPFSVVHVSGIKDVS